MIADKVTLNLSHSIERFMRLQSMMSSGRRIEKPSEIRPALEEALKINRKGVPAVLDFVTGIDMSHFERAE